MPFLLLQNEVMTWTFNLHICYQFFQFIRLNPTKYLINFQKNVVSISLRYKELAAV